jgi:hypothetical protein
MLTRVLVFLSFMFCIQGAMTGAMADERPEMGRYVKAFSGDLGVVVRLTRIGPPSNNEVILQVEGVDHPWDKMIVKHRVEYANNRETYTATLPNGSEFQTFLLTETTGQLYLPNTNRAMRVSYDGALASQENPQHFLTAYLKQEAEKNASKQKNSDANK